MYLLQVCSLHCDLALVVGVSEVDPLRWLIWLREGLCLKVVFFPEELFPSCLFSAMDERTSLFVLGKSDPMTPFLVFLEVFWLLRILFGPWDVEL